MMATGGVSVLVRNDGNAEYIKDGKNALYYNAEDIDNAVKKIESVVSDTDKFHKMAKTGRKTANERKWENIEKAIVDMYT